MVYAKKSPNMLSTFSKLVWRNMGKRKGGWVEISEEEYNALKEGKPEASAKGIAAASSETAAQKAKMLMGQGLGFEKDGKLKLALAKYEAAAAVKKASATTKAINRVVKAIEETEKAQSPLAQTIAAANDLFDAEDYTAANEMYLAAAELDATDKHVIARLVECDDKMLS